MLCDALIHPAVLRHARHDAEVLVVGKRGGEASATQDEILHTMLFRARQGRRVARVKGGDPMVFGRAVEELEFLAAHGVSYEIIPGVTAALGASAYAAIPLTDRDLSASVALVTATERPDRDGSQHDWSRLSTATRTIVVYMGLRRLRETLDTLVANGRSAACPAAVISHASLASQRVVSGTLADLANRVDAVGLPSPAILIVGEVVTKHDALKWWSPGPLADRRVVVTRASEQAGSLVDSLWADGAEVIELPALRFAPPSDETALRELIASLPSNAPEVLAFSSANGVRFFFDALAAASKDARALAPARVAAIGPATAAALRHKGIEADLIAERYVAEGLVEAILSHLAGRLGAARVALVRAEEGRDAIVDALREKGVAVEVVSSYRTLSAFDPLDSSARAAFAAGVDAVTFMSPSAVTHLCAALGDDPALLEKTVIASIGPVTSEAIRARGLRVSVEAEPHTAEALLDALRAHFCQESESP